LGRVLLRLAVFLTLVGGVFAGAGGAFAATQATISGATDDYCSPYVGPSQFCPRANQPPVEFGSVPAGVKTVTVTWDGPGFCSQGTLIIYVDGSRAGDTKPNDGPGGKGESYMNDGSVTIALPLDGKSHTLAWRVEGYEIPPPADGGCNSGVLVQFTGTVTAQFAAPAGASLSVVVSIAAKNGTVAIGDETAVTVKVIAGAQDLTNVELGSGLVPSSASATVTKSPSGLGGFDLASGSSRSFDFTVKGVKAGSASLKVDASADSAGGAAHGSDSAKLKVGETLAIDWTMPHRLYPDNSDWGGELGLPPASYVSPSDWTVELFLTDGDAKTCPSGVTFDWTVTGAGKTITPDTHECRASAQVPKLGTYAVTAKEMKDGKATGTEATNKKVIVKDWLIVGFGDSNGSGQGNPPYINPRCDRSVASYQYQTALYVENHDPRSSVTFVFDSCSGARSDQVWQNSYEGQEPSGNVILPPQIDQVKSVIGDRKPDAVIMSVGINDLYFGSIMGFCATYNSTGTAFTNHTCESAHVTPTKDALGYTTAYSESADFADATVATRTAERIRLLPGRLALLNDHLRSLDAAHIFASQYPDESTNAKGQLCDDTAGPFPKLSSTVWGWLQQTGSSLNAAVAGTSSLGWVPITGVAAGFVGHGYCSTDSYFDTPPRSLWEQGNSNGSFHATAKGAAITFALTRDKVCEKLYGNADCDGNAPEEK
jgi:hypothetical protein